MSATYANTGPPAGLMVLRELEPDSADHWQVEVTEQAGGEITATTHELVTTTTAADGRTTSISAIVQP